MPVDASPAWLQALARVSRLTPREYEVFLLLETGSSNQEIADRLVVTERTVRAHLAQVMAKMQLTKRLEASLASYVHCGGQGRDCRDRQYRGSGPRAHDNRAPAGLNIVKGGWTMKKNYQTPRLIARGSFTANTAGRCRFFSDRGVCAGRLIP